MLSIVVLELEDVHRDLNQEGVEDALVPFAEDISNFIIAELESTLEDIVGLCNQLHVAVLDT